MGGFLIDSIALQLNIKAYFMVYGYMSGQWKDNRKESCLFLLALKYLSKDPAERFSVTIFLLKKLHLKYPPAALLL